ncbi:hypothetical protein [Nocardioides nitrophenolicus]|uniref:hypothetical protein n=1 Tax=Nocardioides nitrophenolicus TaxID=60489 RepID=UPI00195C813A|nr:hypothetical protein [Nocardioides nitrophenolicus]MBM7516290.1 hypothetical protein [Nocardioides nitrophenolicus]
MPTSALAVNVIYGALPDPDSPTGSSFSSFPADGRAFFVSPRGSAQDYGWSPPIQVRTIAFGAIPVEATLQLSQTVDDDGELVGLHFSAVTNREPENARTRYDPAPLEGTLDVHLRDVKVDGVPVNLGRCAAPRARLQAVSDALYVSTEGGGDFANYDPGAGGFQAIMGGIFNGVVAIPPFGECRTTTGDDIAPLLTAMVSGEDNPVRIRVGSPSCFTPGPDYAYQLPPAPGQSDPVEANCLQWGGNQWLGDFNPRVYAIPPDLPLPDGPRP